MTIPTSDELKRLANNYAHCYAFVGDDTMPLKQAELYGAIDSIFQQLAAINVETITKALSDYKCCQWTIVDEFENINHAPLVDVLAPSNAPDIGAGKIEIAALAEYLADELQFTEQQGSKS